MAPELHQVAGNLAMPGFTAPKLLWVRRHEPQHFQRTATVLLPKDYLRYRMTGKKVSDMSDAAGTLWLDVAKRDWSDALLDKCGLSRSQMPTLVEGCEVSATLDPQVAARWGLNASVMVAGGGGDNAVSAIGVGAVSPGDAFISLGTSGVLFVVTDAYRPAPQSAVHAFCHVLPNLWHQMSVMLSAASCLQWFCRLTGTTEVALLAEIAELSEEDKANAPFFLPYLSGERTPHNDPDARGIFWGMTHASLRAQLGYAVLEGELWDQRRPAGVKRERDADRAVLAGGRGRPQPVLGPAAGRYSRYAGGDPQRRRDRRRAGRGAAGLPGGGQTHCRGV